MSNKNCPNCKFDCQGQCKKIDTEDEGVEYAPISDADLERGASPFMKVVDVPTSNGGW